MVLLTLCLYAVWRLNVPFGGSPDGEISFLDLRTTQDQDIARNGNWDSKWAYFVLALSFLTGLNGAVLGMFFRIGDYWAYYWE